MFKFLPTLFFVWISTNAAAHGKVNDNSRHLNLDKEHAIHTFHQNVNLVFHGHFPKPISKHALDAIYAYTLQSLNEVSQQHPQLFDQVYTSVIPVGITHGPAHGGRRELLVDEDSRQAPAHRGLILECAGITGEGYDICLDIYLSGQCTSCSSGFNSYSVVESGNWLDWTHVKYGRVSSRTRPHRRLSSTRATGRRSGKKAQEQDKEANNIKNEKPLYIFGQQEKKQNNLRHLSHGSGSSVDLNRCWKPS